jgi:hypothetical protein
MDFPALILQNSIKKWDTCRHLRRCRLTKVNHRLRKEQGDIRTVEGRTVVHTRFRMTGLQINRGCSQYRYPMRLLLHNTNRIITIAFTYDSVIEFIKWNKNEDVIINHIKQFQLKVMHRDMWNKAVWHISLLRVWGLLHRFQNPVHQCFTPVHHHRLSNT